MKQIIFNKQAREKLAKGADILATAVVSTLGPRSLNAAISRKGQVPLIAHDGFTVALNVVPLKDPFENLGAELLREASANTNDLVGDGTTTSTLLANYLIQEGLKLTSGGILDGNFANINPMVLKEELDKAAIVIEDLLKKQAVKLNLDDAFKIAKISSGNDEIAKLVSDAVVKVGESGMIMTGVSDGFNSYIEHKEGMEFDNGYLSPYFMTDPRKGTAEYEDAYILLADKTIVDHQEITPILEKVAKEHNGKMPIIIIANDVAGFALQGLIQLKLQNTLPTCAVVAPEFADRRKEMLEDLAVLTGGVVFSPDKKDDLRNLELKDLGRASVRITHTHTLLTPKFPDKEEIDERILTIKEQIANETNDFRKSRLKDRLAKLSQGVAIIRVGGGSEAEVNDKRLRIDDAVHAVRAAITEGIVVGGGVALYRMAIEMQHEDMSPIETLINNALMQPFQKLMSNSGIDAVKVLQEIDLDTEVYDVVGKKILKAKDMLIMDPVKVTRLAIRHSFSVAGMFLTTDTLIVDEPETDIQKIKVVGN